MNISYNWLKEYVPIPYSPNELANKLTMIGLETGIIESEIGPDNCVIGQIVEVNPLPKTNKLKLCKVDVGEILTIVCGAPNVNNGDMIPVALPGAKIFDRDNNEIIIKRTKLYGVVSEGMLCSEVELNLGKDSSGLMILDKNSKPGTHLKDYLGLRDYILEIELTPNRADCLSHFGIAREIAAISGTTAKLPHIQFQELGKNIETKISVQIENSTQCPRYTAALIKNVSISESPAWLRQKLLSIGLRPINNVVDITNFVLMELGQPLHAFDYDLIKEKKIIIRNGVNGELLKTLNDEEQTLDATMLTIADAKTPIALAGIMGGAKSEVGSRTKNILIESALFNQSTIRKTSKNLGLSTEASYRFERGIDPQMVTFALSRSVQLILELAGGVVSKGIIDIYPKPLPIKHIRLRPGRTNQVLGLHLSSEEIITILKNLHIEKSEKIKDSDSELIFKIPSHRQDIELEADLMEEIARIYGYDKIPISIPPDRVPGGKNNYAKDFEKNIKNILIENEFCEVVNYSFTEQTIFQDMSFEMIEENNNALLLIKNPLVEDQNALRYSLIPGLLQNLVTNSRRQISDAKFFEIGTCFFPQKGKELPNERIHLGLVIMGRMNSGHWSYKMEEVDYYNIKGIIELLFDKIGVFNYYFAKAKVPWLEESICQKIVIDGKEVGLLGKINQRATESFDLRRQAFACEINFHLLSVLPKLKKEFKSLPKYPHVLRDLAIVVDEEIEYVTIFNEIKSIDNRILKDIVLFDIYRGKQITVGKKSMAFSLLFQSEIKTLKDKEVGKIYNKIMKTLEKKFDAKPREI